MGNNIFAQAYTTPVMMRRPGFGMYYPRYGGMMNGVYPTAQWSSAFFAYHVVVALLILVILILLVVLLWKKIELMDQKEEVKNAKK